MKSFFFLTLFFMLLLSCRQEVSEKPENLISETEMEAILYDLAVLNSAKGISNKKFQDRGVLPEAYLYKKYDIDSLQLVESVMYYAARPEVYLAMQKNVEARLTGAKQQAEETKKINDSLNNIKKFNRDSLLSRRKRDKSKLIKTADSLR